MIYDKNLEIQEEIDTSMIEVCAEKVVYPKQDFFFFCFIFAVAFFIMVILEKNLSTKLNKDIKNSL